MITAAQLKTLSTDQLRSLNEIIVREIRLRMAVEASDKLSEFHRGQKVKFQARDGTIVYGEINRFTPKSVKLTEEYRTTATGKPADWATRKGCNWTVSPQFLSPA